MIPLADTIDARILTEAPDHLVMRHPKPVEQRHRAKQLAAWCNAHGIRPTLMDLERERLRRDPKAAVRVTNAAARRALAREEAAR